MSIFQCDKCLKFVDNLIHACDPLPKGQFPAWACGDCHEVCNCSITEHAEVCPGGHDVSFPPEHVPSGPTLKDSDIGSAYKTYILGSEALVASPAAGVKLTGIEQPPKAEWDTMAYQAQDNIDATDPNVLKIEYESDAVGITQKTYFKDGSMSTHWVNKAVGNVDSLAAAKIKKPFVIKSDGGEFDKSEVLRGNLETDGKGGWRRKPRLRPAFDLSDKPREHWCWMVEVRRMQRAVVGGPDPMDFWGDFTKERRHAPYGFGGKASALRRMMELMDRESYNVGKGIAEFRVVPHFLGYIPEEEDWYRVAWPEWKNHCDHDRRKSMLGWKGMASKERRKTAHKYDTGFPWVESTE